MSSQMLIQSKKDLKLLQKKLGQELVKGKQKDLTKIRELRNSIKSKKLQIGSITKSLISQL
ncbi:MAG: hypothetical protein ACOWWR_01020 [Eubacteriales bacterium]